MELLVKMEDFLAQLAPYFTIIVIMALLGLGAGMTYGSERLQNTLRDRIAMIVFGCAVFLGAYPIAKLLVSIFS